VTGPKGHGHDHSKISAASAAEVRGLQFTHTHYSEVRMTMRRCNMTALD
jgi:hypothetical protein